MEIEIRYGFMGLMLYGVLKVWEVRWKWKEKREGIIESDEFKW